MERIRKIIRTIRLHYNYPQIVTTFAVSVVSITTGLCLGYTGTALDSISDPNDTQFDVSKFELSWIVSALSLGGFLGSILGGVLISLIGRKWTILFTTFPLIISFCIIGFSSGAWMIIVGRLIGGICIGVNTMAIPIFLSETITPQVRGLFGMMPLVFSNGGILLSYILGKYFKWQNLAFVSVAFPGIFLFLMMLVSESPRYYVCINLEGRARTTLQWLRGKNTDITKEMDEIIEGYKYKDVEEKQLTDLFSRRNLRSFLVIIGLMTIQNFSGYNAVIGYIVTIFKSAKMELDSYTSAIVVGAVNLLVAFVAALLIDLVGRRFLLYTSIGAMIVSLLTLGYYFLALELGYRLYEKSWIPLGSVGLFVVGYALGFGPIPWLMMGEILPSSVRSKAAAVASAFNWFIAFIVQFSFLYMIDAVTACGAFWFFCAVCIAGLFMIIVAIPETKGKTLEMIELEMTAEPPPIEEDEEEEPH